MAAEEKRNNQNLLLVVLTLVLFSAVSSVCSAYICQYVLDSFEDGQAMVLLITSEGLKSDDKKLEGRLNRATLALNHCRDLGLALGIGAAGVGIAAGLRIWRDYRQKGQKG